MGDKTSIHWTDATWNPTVGCKRVSAGCDHCYAFALHDQRHIAWKRGRYPDAPAQYHVPFSQVQLVPDRLELPLHWRKPRMVFVNSMSDLFHEAIPDEYIRRVFAVMGEASRHTFQVLTKRPKRMRRFVSSLVAEGDFATLSGVAKPLPYPNVWLGTSVENQETADERIPHLLQTPAAVRFLSCEPLLGPISRLYRLPGHFYTADYRPADDSLRRGIHWVIVGGESGPHYREMDLNWARSLRDQCQWAGVAFFYKQGGGLRPGTGRELDGRLWEEFPERQGA